MIKLLELIKNGESWSLEDISIHMHTTVEDVKRQLEYLEHMGIVSKVLSCQTECRNCKASCDLGLGRTNMPVFYELVKT